MAMATFLIGNANSQTCPNGLVSYWNLDDASDVLFEDKSGNNDAVAETSIEMEAVGKVGAAKYFDGDDIVNVANDADFDFGANSSFSVELWVKFSELVGTLDNIFIGKNDPTGTGAYWSIGVDLSTGKLYFDLRDSNGNLQTILTSGSINNNAWHHIVAVRNEASNQNILYLDGSVAGSVTFDYLGNFTSSADINIGYLIRQGLPRRFFKGRLDEIAIYNTALTSTNVTEHYSKNISGLGVCDEYSPLITSAPNTTAVVGQQYTYTVKATGMPTMTYSLVSSPAGMTIDPATGEISWTPASVNEDGLVKIRAANSYPPADTQSYRIFLADAPVCPEGIITLFKLNETGGTTYVDYYNEHTIAATVAPTPTAGKLYGGQLFNATTLLDIPDAEGDNTFEWAYSSNFSFEFWVKTASSATMVVLGRSREDFPAAANMWVGLSAGKATFYLHENDTAASGIWYEITGGPALNDNTWHHVIAVRNGSVQENRLYVDGIEVASVPTSYNNSFSCDLPTEINLGWFDNTATGYHFVGALDEVAIFDKAISDAEALSFFNAGVPAGHCAIDNYAPVITSAPILAATEDMVYSYTFTVEDNDVADLIALSAPTKPAWLNFNYTPGQKSAVLTATPSNDNTGDHNIVLSVSDGQATKEQSFTITVTAVNDAPVITSTEVVDGYVDDLYAYVFTATDVDNPELILSAVQIPAWLTFNPDNGILTGTPAQIDKGEHLVILRVSDGTLTEDQTFTITVDGPDGLEDLTSAGINIYPVPARDYLNVTFTTINEKVHLELINATGSTIKKVVVPANQKNFRLDLTGMENGIYYLHLKNNSINNIGRFVITK